MSRENPKKVQVAGYKYDGTLRDTYEAQLLDHVGSTVRLLVPTGTLATDKNGDVVEGDDNVIEIYFTDRWYNVWHMADHKHYQNLWYCNIAMPAKFDGETLRWVDLDLDVRCHLDGWIKVLDEDEFEENRLAMSYTDKMVHNARAALDEVLKLGKAGEFPFDYERQIADSGYIW